MSSFVHISDATSLAIHALICLSVESNQERRTTWAMAETLGVSEAHLGKVLQRLGKLGFVRARRGPGGGFNLARAPREISLLQIFEAIEGPLETPGCLLGRQRCVGARCCLGPILGRVDREMRDYLGSTSLFDLFDAETLSPSKPAESDPVPGSAISPAPITQARE